MPTDDKKEYRDTLELLDHTGSGPAVLNKLGKLTVKVHDPRLQAMLQAVGSAFHGTPETRHYEKFRLLSWAHSYSLNSGSRKSLSDHIHTIEKYCRAHIATQAPQWQLIALAAGWAPNWQAAARTAGWAPPAPAVGTPPQ